MKLVRIDKIKNFRVFRDFIWPSDLNDFENYNLIYGWNWSGKTTLSTILRCLEKRIPLSDGEIELTIGGRKVSGKEFADEASLPSIKVFNRDFINDNVFTSEGSVTPIFVLGEESIDKQKQVKDKKSENTERKARLSEKQKEKSTLEKELDNYCIEKGKAIKEFLSSSGQNPYNNYDKASFKNKCTGLIQEGHVESNKLTEEEKERLKKKNESAAKAKVQNIAFTFENVSTLSCETQKILSKTVTSRVIDKLKDNQELSKWVEKGLQLHKETLSSVCLFCEQSLPEDRLQILEGHFNDEYSRFTNEIEAMKKNLESKLKMVENLTFPDEARLYEHLADMYVKRCSELEQEINIYNSILKNLITKLSEKKSNPFKVLALNTPPTPMNEEKFNAVNSLIRQHNQETDDFQTTVSGARQKLESSIVAELIPEFSEKRRNIERLSGACDALTNEIQGEERSIQELERDIIEHRKPAEELNGDLQNYLGHSELKFEVKEAGYQITRNGNVAGALSEGEKTAVAFLYFLKSLYDKNFDLANGIVVIDDPVSSLDSNSLYNAFGFMKNRVNGAGQFFLLTHNFLFFRQVRHWFGHLTKSEVRYYMLQVKTKDGTRKSELLNLDRLLKDYHSEYHYLFSLVYQTANSGNDSHELVQYHYYTVT